MSVGHRQDSICDYCFCSLVGGGERESTEGAETANVFAKGQCWGFFTPFLREGEMREGRWASWGGHSRGGGATGSRVI